MEITGGKQNAFLKKTGTIHLHYQVKIRQRSLSCKWSVEKLPSKNYCFFQCPFYFQYRFVYGIFQSPSGILRGRVQIKWSKINTGSFSSCVKNLFVWNSVNLESPSKHTRQGPLSSCLSLAVLVACINTAMIYLLEKLGSRWIAECIWTGLMSTFFTIREAVEGLQIFQT